MVTEGPDPLLETTPKMRPGQLIIQLKRAQNLRGKEFLCFGKANVYALMTIGGEKRKSKVISRGGSSPVWEEQLSFKIAEHVHFALYNVLYIHLYDQDVRKDSHRGTVKIEVANLLEEHGNELPTQSYPLIYKGKPKGTVVLGLTFIPSNRKAVYTVKSP